MNHQSTLTLSENCPICFGGRTESFICKTEKMWKCCDCHFIFLDQKRRNKINQMELFCESNNFEFWSIPKYYEKYHSIFIKYFDRRYAILKKYLKSPFTILDVGCGHAFWGQYLANKGEIYQGIDISSDVIHSTKSGPLNIHCSSFENFETTDRFQCLTLCDVLEHMPEPRKMIQKCSALLYPSGLLYIQVPSVFGLKIPFGHDPGLPFHFWHFSQKNLRQLLEDEGFEIIKLETGILGIIGKMEKQNKIYFWQQLFWAVARCFKRGNRLQILAKKIKTD